MSRQNKVNPGRYTQRGRLTQDDAARELRKQSLIASPNTWQPVNTRTGPRLPPAVDANLKEGTSAITETIAETKPKAKTRPKARAKAVKAKTATTRKSKRAAVTAKTGTAAKARKAATSAKKRTVARPTAKAARPR